MITLLSYYGSICIDFTIQPCSVGAFLLGNPLDYGGTCQLSAVDTDISFFLRTEVRFFLGSGVSRSRGESRLVEV